MSKVATAATASRAETERLTVMFGKMNRRLQFATGGLSHGLLSALAMVAKRGPLRLSDLAQLESVSAPTITRTVAELEARGYVTRRADPEDGRAVLVEITQSGQTAVLDARATRTELVSGLLAELEPTDVATIMSALPALERLIDPS
jgi:DNA-binding MarR family transcriptional regulator